MSHTVTCPNCGRSVEWSADNRWRPFCSERCRMVDLAGWIDESHRIPGIVGSDAVQEWEASGGGSEDETGMDDTPD